MSGAPFSHVNNIHVNKDEIISQTVHKLTFLLLCGDMHFSFFFRSYMFKPIKNYVTARFRFLIIFVLIFVLLQSSQP